RECGRSGGSCPPADHRRDGHVGDEGDAHHGYPKWERLKAPTDDEAPDRLEGDHRRPDKDQDSFDRRGEVLDFLVAVTMGLVGGFAGLPDRGERDDRSDQVDARMHGLGEDRDRACHRRSDYLEQDQRRVGYDREGRRPQLAAVSAHDPRDRIHSASARAAWPRWLIASFSSSESSAIVRLWASPSGTNAGSYPKPRDPVAVAARCPRHSPWKRRSSPLRGSTYAITHT